MAAENSDQRLDSHQHFWTLSRIERGEYHWMAEGGPLREDYLPERLEPELRDTYCKLSGMVTEVGPDWTTPDFEPYASFVFETFGADRVMFGSDWPVCRLAVAEYRDILQLADRLVSPLARDDADAFWRRNAERFYGVRVTERRKQSS
jgi:predicted TIM-barrel fold metal-dependent hydrolase